MQLGMRAEQQLGLFGGMTDSIFVHTESLLNEEGDYWHALSFVAAKKKMDTYRSVMDFIFVEIAVGPWRGRCMNFYRGDTQKQAKDWLTPEEIALWDAKLVRVLNVAVEWFRQERYDTWTQFRLAALNT